ncbi:MAG: flagellar basal body rod protein FlgB [candidate division Zixibacteria bacterium]|nr:flagellar basal body rod protein FlgB [candidate division Zixibacteria bacterium]
MGIIDSHLVYSSKINLFEKSLDTLSLRHKSIAGNIANISTSGYKRKYVDFSAEMRKAVKNKGTIKLVRTDPVHRAGMDSKGIPEMKTDKDNSGFNGVNNVDVDREMTDLAENHIIYKTAATLLARRFRGLKAAIRGRS